MIRRIELAVIALVIVIAALSTGAQFLFFLVYLGILVVGGSYVVTRFGLADLEAGYVLDRLHAQTGDILRASYTVRNTSRLPKFWLEVRNPSTLPVELPAEAVSLGPRGEKSWSVRVPLTRRGHFRVEPVALRTGDPLGLFESQASVGAASNVIVYPHVDALPAWKLPPALIEGSNAHPERTPHTTPHATSIRPYASGDPYNRIHWKSTARTGEMMVKTFELDPASDIWVILDLERRQHAGKDEESTEEYGVRIAASLVRLYINLNRPAGLILFGRSLEILDPERGPQQLTRALEMLATAHNTGDVPLGSVLMEEQRRFGRHTTLVIVTASIDDEWLTAAQTLGQRGVRMAAILIDPSTFAERPSSLLLYGQLTASDIMTYVVSRGDDLAVALSPSHTGVGAWPE